MSVPPSATRDPDGRPTPDEWSASDGLGGPADRPGRVEVTLTLSLAPDEVAALRRAAAVRCLPVATFTLQAALAEAWRMAAERPSLATATTRRLGEINEVFDRLAAALGDSEKTLTALGTFIRDTMGCVGP